jgi:[ribosomal protein S18]-alanine N-acetyltransferase
MSAQLKPNLQLRPMQMDDLDTIMQIEPTIYTHPWTRGNFSDSLNSGYSAWVLEDTSLGKTSEMIGYALMMRVLDEAHLLNLSIAKTQQKRGLGRYLLEHMLKIAKTHKATNMFLEVRPSNISAIALYENMGFCEISVRRGYYPADPKISETGREDAILMGLAL